MQSLARSPWASALVVQLPRRIIADSGSEVCVPYAATGAASLTVDYFEPGVPPTPMPLSGTLWARAGQDAQVVRLDIIDLQGERHWRSVVIQARA